MSKEGGLKGFEIPKHVTLLDELFSLENKCLTPTFKIVRNEVRKLCGNKLETM